MTSPPPKRLKKDLKPLSSRVSISYSFTYCSSRTLTSLSLSSLSSTLAHSHPRYLRVAYYHLQYRPSQPRQMARQSTWKCSTSVSSQQLPDGRPSSRAHLTSATAEDDAEEQEPEALWVDRFSPSTRVSHFARVGSLSAQANLAPARSFCRMSSECTPRR